MAHPRKSPKQKYTYADYLTWPDDERWELIEGEAFDMTPAPNTSHQAVLVELSRQLANFFLGKPCNVFVAPFDVRLPKKNESDMETKTVVQPDILVICDLNKIDARGCRGAPDLAIEILSPSSVSHDQLRKLNLYESRGVREYWIIHVEGSVMVFRLGESGRYGRPETHDRTTKIETPLFPGLTIDLSTVFPENTRVVKQSPRGYSAGKTSERS